MNINHHATFDVDSVKNQMSMQTLTHRPTEITTKVSPMRLNFNRTEEGFITQNHRKKKISEMTGPFCQKMICREGVLDEDTMFFTPTRWMPNGWKYLTVTENNRFHHHPNK
jgi:hypothetical protein